MRRQHRLGLALLAGGLLSLGHPPFSLWPAALAALSAAFWLFSKCQTPGQAAWTGWMFGLGYFASVLVWIVQPFFVDAAVTGWMAPFALVGMGGGMALFWALAFWGAARFRGGWLMLVGVWALVELARAYVFTGFPWGLVGYALAPTWAAHWAAVIGSHGLTLLTLGLTALAAASITAARSKSTDQSAATPKHTAPAMLIGSTVLLAGVMFGGGFLLRPAAPDVVDRPIVRMVQPNAPQHLKWHPDHIPTFFQRQVTATSAPGDPDLIVWPETALPMLLGNADQALDIIATAAGGAPVVMGVQRYEDGYFNAMILMEGQGQVTQLYDKHHLVPFGEYMPFSWLFRHISIGGLAQRTQAAYSAGPGPSIFDTPLGAALPLICYEAVFPQDVTGAPTRPAYLLQVTNDAWFGTWSGPQQHLMQARMRAIETGLPLVRAANTGVSAMIGPGGRILASLPLGQQGFVDAPLPNARVSTIYWKTGDWLVFVLILGTIIGALTLSFRNSD